MEITIAMTKDEEDALKALIELWTSSGFKDYLFSTDDKDFLDKYRYIIQENLKDNQIIDWFPDGCSYIKFKFTELGLGLIRIYKPEVFNGIKPFLCHRSISEHHLPNVIFKNI